MFLELFILLIFFWLIYDYYQHIGLPKGLLRFPIFGNIPQILLANPKYIHLAFQKIGKNYKDFVLIKLGTKEIVVINSYTVVKELFKKDLVSKKLFKPLDALYPVNIKGLGNLNGQEAIDQRKLFHSFLAEFGFGNQKMHISMAQEEAENYIKFCEKIAFENNGKVDMMGNLHISIFNILFKIVTGNRRNYDDVEILDFLKKFKHFFKKFAISGTIGEIFPFTKAFFDGNKLAINCANKLKCCVEKILMNELKNLEYDKEKNYILKKFNAKAILEEKFLCVFIDILLGALETTADSLLWTFIYLAHNFHVQEKIHDEIDNAFIKKPDCLYESKFRLNYLQATILESLRISPFVPFAAPRIVLEDIEYKGIHLPKGTEILGNIYSINNDPNFWKSPEIFDPTRFIDPSSGVIFQNRLILNFGSGKRECLGQSYALDVMYTYFATILKHFKISPVPNELPSLEPIAGAVLQPKPFQLIFKKCK